MERRRGDGQETGNIKKMTTEKNLIRVASYNVNGVLNPIKRLKILNKMKKDGVGVIVLQKTHLTEKEHKKLRRGGYNQIFSASYKSGHRRGVAILISGRISFEKLIVTLLNIYAPPCSDWTFNRQMFDLMTSEVEDTLISGGDLIQRLNPQLDSSAGGTQKNVISRKNKGINVLNWV